MTQRQIPFSIEKWKEGLQPVTRDGMEVKQLTLFEFGCDHKYPLAGIVDSALWQWDVEGKPSLAGEKYSLMLLEEVPEPREWDVWITPNGAIACFIGEPHPKWERIKVREVLE